MRKNIEFSIGALLIGCAVAACSGGGGSTSLPAAPPHGTTPAAHQNVAFTITVPAKTTSARSPKYVSASTQSVSIVETDGTAPALPAVVQNTTPGSPNCTTASGATSCTITVNANVGADSFTVKTYDAANATGNLLSSGTVQGTVVSGAANSFPLTLGGTVASFTLAATDAYPQVNGTTTLTAIAKDAGGNTIVGTYDSPIALTSSASGGTLSQASFASSSDKSTLTLSASQTSSFTISGSVNGKTGSLTINPSSGVVYYNVGSGSNDATGFHIIAGNDGKLYYTTLGLLTCANSGFCYGNSGALGQFDPATGNFNEIPFPTDEPVAPYQTSDGTVWVSLSSETVNANGSTTTNGFVGRVSGGFSQANLSTVALPTPAPFDGDSRPRSFALGPDGNLYLTGNTDHKLYKIPVSNPSTSSITAIVLPTSTAPPNAAWQGAQAGEAQGITTGADGNLYLANFAFTAPNVLQYNTTSGAFTAFDPPGGQGPEPRYIVTGSDGNLYQSFGGVCTVAPCNGGLNAMTTAGTFTQIATPDAYSEPDDLAAGTGFVAFVDLGQGGFGTYNFTSKEVRDYPITPMAANNFQCCSVSTAPDGITVGSDGSLWYITYGTVTKGGPLAIAHVVMTSNWSVWPSQQLNLNGTGTANAQLVGIMESGDSGPFTVTSSDSTVATLQPITGESHNYHLVGIGPGTCTVTITDKNGRSESIAVTVTQTSGTVSGGARGAVATKGGLF